MPLTLEEIAKEAGVSRSTVSRVLNKHPNVSPDARERVLAVTQRLDFTPNMLARSLAGGHTQVLGLVIPMGVSVLFTDPYFPILIQGVASACNAHDYSVMLWLAEPEQERRVIQKILQGGLIDGVVVSSMLIDDPLVKALLDRQMPFILIGRHPTDQRVSYIDIDNRNSAREMVAYLLRLGYHRIATVTGPQNMIAGADRLEGYQMALRERGILPDPVLIASGDFTEVGAYTATRRLLPHEPDAIFCASDAMAIGVMRALREAGKRVPEDVGLAGFDDIPIAARMEPPLTTVRQPIHRTGAVAAETLIDLIQEGESRPRRVILPTELVIRSSCRSI
ncbi:MAG: LacI family DNA-binding transcriptional regulator [Anaerolineae bacterium]